MSAPARRSPDRLWAVEFPGKPFALATEKLFHTRQEARDWVANEKALDRRFHIGSAGYRVSEWRRVSPR